ncbi:carbohydrate kinase [Solitalea longa]|uniref:Carbohydrate kinase n=1 Tax=Solitalea longa TaxID=2079460 RepID=A0A2S5A0L1_9SPHI|nr:sugar kinase [Solitalea longa]POY35849.1 carbohydrate kinase [Solitalea longa]
MTGKVLSFGELLLRICPDMKGSWLEQNQLPFYVGGAEANVATALALWGVPSAYFTALPDNLMAHQLVSYLKSKQINTDRITFQGDRIGLYYLPKGSDLKNAGVIYDRSNSSFSNLKPGTINWDEVFEGVSWLHFSAICPALNQQVANVCLEAVKAAKAKNITISLDLNYRAKLWQYGKKPTEIVPELAQYCTLIMGNLWAANTMLGITLQENIFANDNKEAYLEHAELTSKAIMNVFPNCKAVANTFRFDKYKGIKYYTTLYTNNRLLVSQEHSTDLIIDKVGSGDCFMAGLIYGFYNELPPAETLEFATAAAYKKLFILSDATSSTVEEVNQLIVQYAK